MSVIASTTTIAVPMNSATSSCNRQRRMKYRAIVLITSIRTRVAPTHAPPTSTAMNSVRRYPSVVGPSMPTTAETWRCHAAAGINISTDAAMASTTVAALITYCTRFGGGHQVRLRITKRRNSLQANTPMP